ncbi:c-type cytochrome [Methylobacterium oxalidis]|uniref:Cytochrome c n=1 Tax=Methylobacterium oxalidis TaxID=944322 RepID=A0A512J5G9_9HYPH|nr:cytochrome c family protein [Methylobacterium oxalidis]GEP05221.1 cytochrome c [Methylobacterium oxalidis]GJE34221.1 Cytochrome c-554 [Methylobacterium oxalidis]GLS66361.1 cytochrome c [Methylobacterium oxalidis]
MRSLIVSAVLALLIPVAGHAQDAGDPAAGEKAFAPCKACHAFDKNGVGPNLTGVVGRKAASLEGYNYSPALKNSGLTWDQASLHEWLKNPKAKVPGTKMVFAGIPDDKKINDVIAYLSTKK